MFFKRKHGEADKDEFYLNRHMGAIDKTAYTG